MTNTAANFFSTQSVASSVHGWHAVKIILSTVKLGQFLPLNICIALQAIKGTDGAVEEDLAYIIHFHDKGSKMNTMNFWFQAILKIFLCFSLLQSFYELFCHSLWTSLEYISHAAKRCRGWHSSD